MKVVNIPLNKINYGRFDTRLTIQYHMYDIINKSLHLNKYLEEKHAVVLTRNQENEDRYDVIDGNLRLSLCEEQKINIVPALVISDTSEEEIIRDIANFNSQRQLTQLEIGLLILKICKSHRSPDKISEIYAKELNKSKKFITVALGAAKVYSYFESSGAFESKDKLVLRNKAHHLFYMLQCPKRYWIELIMSLLNNQYNWSYIFTHKVVLRVNNLINEYSQEYIDLNMNTLIANIVSELMKELHPIKHILIKLNDGCTISKVISSNDMVTKLIEQIMQSGFTHSINGCYTFISPNRIYNIVAQ